MIRFFRINDPYRLVFIFILLVLIRFGQSRFISDISYYELKWLLLGEWLSKGFLLYTETFDYTGPLAAFVYKYMDYLFGRNAFAHHVISSFVIILQAGIFNHALLKNKAYDENSYLPAFLYMILMVAVPDFMALSPQLLSLTLVLLVFRKVLHKINNQVNDELFLNSGLLLGVATMIYLPSIVFFIQFLFSLILFSTAGLRRLLLYFFGFLLIISVCVLYFRWFGSMEVFIQSFIMKSPLVLEGTFLDFTQLLILSSPFMFIFILSAVKTWSSVHLTSFQQKVQHVIWLMFFGGVATFFLSNERSGHELVFVVPVIAHFWTYYFMHLRWKIFKILMPGILVLGLIGYSGYAYLHLTESLVAKEVSGVKKNSMILGGHLNFYKEVEMATPCFDQHLSKDAFERLKYYEGASQLYELLRKTNPDLMFDSLNVVQQLFHRFPTIEKNYEQIKPGIYKRIRNKGMPSNNPDE